MIQISIINAIVLIVISMFGYFFHNDITANLTVIWFVWMVFLCPLFWGIIDTRRMEAAIIKKCSNKCLPLKRRVK